MQLLHRTAKFALYGHEHQPCLALYHVAADAWHLLPGTAKVMLERAIKARLSSFTFDFVCERYFRLLCTAGPENESKSERTRRLIQQWT